MAGLFDIKDTIIAMFPENSMTDTVWEYGFKFNFDRDITTISYATNFTPFTITEAAKNHADLLITHHDAWPFMNMQKEYCNQLLEDNQINHCFIHTPLDAVEFGTSHSLAIALKIKNPKFTLPYFGKLVGVAGDIEAQTFASLVKLCETVLHEPVRSYQNSNNLCTRILVATGGGQETSSLDSAIAEKCDTYITGEYGMYLQHYAEYHGINLIIGSHTKTEILGVRNFVNKLATYFDALTICEIDEPNY
jgi:putative NIF3 family GTP cyclohydrolase 1 type 2